VPAPGAARAVVEEGPTRVSALASYFKFAERGTNLWTEARGGLTTFMVMVYIVFLNSSILGDGFGLAAGDPGRIALSAGTALVAGLMTIAMGVIGNYPLALAAGLGINAIVAFSLTGRGLTPAGAMGVIVLEGIVVFLLVLVGFREAVMNAVPLGLKRAIGAGIGLFILFIGFANGGLIQSGCSPFAGLENGCVGTLVAPSFPTAPAQFVFLFGLAITFVLWVRGIKAALVISIIGTTLVALAAGVTKIPESMTLTPNFSTLGAFDLTNVFSALPILTAILVIFAIMLTDFFDTMGTVTGVAAEAGLANEDGSVPGVGRVLIVDSAAAAIGGLAGVSSNTTYIESAAGVAEGAKTGFASVVTGLLFLAAVLLAPLAGIIPSVATAPALVLVGYLMFTQVKDINVADIEDGLPALLTMILMPLTYDITVGIGAGFISWVVIKAVRGKTAEIHPLMWVVSIAFIVFFLQAWLPGILPA
jgi:AGZA family xanthine/uracil permease-like MFS transporter